MQLQIAIYRNSEYKNYLQAFANGAHYVYPEIFDVQSLNKMDIPSLLKMMTLSAKCIDNNVSLKAAIVESVSGKLLFELGLNDNIQLHHLGDNAPTDVLVAVDSTKYGLTLSVSGHSDCSSGTGFGAQISIVADETGSVDVCVYSDINQEEPTHLINLSGAMLSNRES